MRSQRLALASAAALFVCLIVSHLRHLIVFLFALAFAPVRAKHSQRTVAANSGQDASGRAHGRPAERKLSAQSRERGVESREPRVESREPRAGLADRREPGTAREIVLCKTINVCPKITWRVGLSRRAAPRPRPFRPRGLARTPKGGPARGSFEAARRAVESPSAPPRKGSVNNSHSGFVLERENSANASARRDSGSPTLSRRQSCGRPTCSHTRTRVNET